MSAILPGATIGILGGGQLGRMTAMAARSLGYRVQVLDPDRSCPASFVVDSCFTASFDDAHAAGDLARGSDVVTLEIEQISLASLEEAARHAPVRPEAAVLKVVQDRIRQKTWLQTSGFPIGEWRSATRAQELAAAVQQFGRDCFIKSTSGGYDGRSQIRLRPSATPASADELWKSLGSRPCVVERALTLDQEISVLVARRPRGEAVVYSPALNHHEEQILDWSAIPASLPADLFRQASDLALQISQQLQVVGLLVIEMFLLKDGRLLVNELAPRPHNSYHASERACATSQFEQAVRAVCDLPLGDASVIKPAAISNLLGDVWLGGHPPAFDRALAIPGVRLHLYEKSVPRPGRKMGHLSAIGDTAQEAVDRVLKARAAL
ncbi:MAG: 5-(carboxyamino)imidazole ribonucleotide synthase [Acidobacteria bacterium]|nr:MAG: 5-(carboxyamino)imidazole ribonucleotide synthase [Acidobacteriota bacterium]PYY17455.1 MAG: 5-(carboxyamino)imidazole ribonucleotide synthase [Acidobacteriota bacterium]